MRLGLAREPDDRPRFRRVGVAEHQHPLAFVAFGVAVLVLPVALLVLTFPRWSERQVTARVIGREVARRAARDGICDRGAARALGTTMASTAPSPEGAQ